MGSEVQTKTECCCLAGFQVQVQYSSYIAQDLGPPSKGGVVQVGQASLINHQPRQLLTDMPTGQSDGIDSSVEGLSSLGVSSLC